MSHDVEIRWALISIETWLISAGSLSDSFLGIWMHFDPSDSLCRGLWATYNGVASTKYWQCWHPWSTVGVHALMCAAALGMCTWTLSQPTLFALRLSTQRSRVMTRAAAWCCSIGLLVVVECFDLQGAVEANRFGRCAVHWNCGGAERSLLSIHHLCCSSCGSWSFALKLWSVWSILIPCDITTHHNHWIHLQSVNQVETGPNFPNS